MNDQGMDERGGIFRAARGKPSPRRRSRPACEALETRSLLTITPLIGSYYPKYAPFAAPSHDYAIYDSTDSTFHVDYVNDPSQKIGVQLGDPSHTNIPLVGSYTVKTAPYTDSQDDFAIYDKTTSTFYVAPLTNPPFNRIAVQLGDPSHDNVPLTGSYLPKTAPFDNTQSDFAIYDRTTATFYVISLTDPSRKVVVQMGDPGHNNIPLVGSYFYKTYPDAANTSDFVIYDATTATFHVDYVNDAAQKLALPLGYPGHDNAPVVGTFTAKPLPFSNLQDDFAIYDRTTATYYVAPLLAPDTRIVVQIGDPSHNNVPVVASYFPKFDPLASITDDFGIDDLTTGTFHVDYVGDPSRKIAVQLGDTTHNNVPIRGVYTPRSAPYSYFQPDYVVYDQNATTFYVGNLNNPFSRFGVQIGDSTHNFVPPSRGRISARRVHAR